MKYFILACLIALFACVACSKSPLGPNTGPKNNNYIALAATPTPSPTSTPTPFPTFVPGKGIGVPPTPDGFIHGSNF